VITFTEIGLSGRDLGEVAFWFFFFLKRSNLFGLSALSEVGLPAWDTGICFRNKMLLRCGALCKTAVQVFPPPVYQGEKYSVTLVVAGFFLNW